MPTSLLPVSDWRSAMSLLAYIVSGVSPDPSAGLFLSVAYLRVSSHTSSDDLFARTPTLPMPHHTTWNTEAENEAYEPPSFSDGRSYSFDPEPTPCRNSDIGDT